MSVKTVLTALREAIDTKLPADQQGVKTIEEMTTAVNSIETGGGSMEIYQCVDADGMTWIVVSGAGSTEANGRYYEGGEVEDDYGGSYKAYYQQVGACSVMFKEGQWRIYSDSTTLYADESWSYYDGDPSQCTGWVVSSGVSPAPTVTKETTTGNGWTGKLYDPETMTVADTETELTYAYTAPKIGKFYTVDGSVLCDIYAPTGIILNYPLTSYTALTGQTFTDPGNSLSFGSLDGVDCAIFNETGYLKNSSIDLPKGSEKRSVSFLCNHRGTKLGFVFGYGFPSSKQLFSFFVNAEHIPCISLFGPDYLLNSAYIEWNTWYHFVITSGDGVCSLYLNGELKEAINIESDSISSNDLFIGGAQDGGASTATYSASVSLAQFRMYNRIMSAEEIAAEAQRCLAMVTE